MNRQKIPLKRPELPALVCRNLPTRQDRQCMAGGEEGFLADVAGDLEEEEEGDVGRRIYPHFMNSIPFHTTQLSYQSPMDDDNRTTNPDSFFPATDQKGTI